MNCLRNNSVFDGVAGASSKYNMPALVNDMKKITILFLIMTLVLGLVSCGSKEEKEETKYKDGTYTGRSSDFNSDEDGNGAGYGEVEITIKDGSIASCDFVLYELDGKVKDETYGEDLSDENRLKAQKAVKAAERYSALLVDGNNLDGVDALSGATITYNEFTEAVKDALSKAKE